MDKYEQLSIVGEGSYGVVIKSRHKETDTIVAIKKFLETEEDAAVRKMALREIRMLKKLKHENLVAMIEVFRSRKRFYIVFEYVEGTILDELEKQPDGLGDDLTRERIFQVIRAVQYIHSNNIIHRDVKPENILISSRGVVKLCDFGFARLIGHHSDAYTEYVATRWYRAPELLIGETHYGPAVDIWAIGCLFAEMMTGEPLFPGESDIDQMHIIVKLMGHPCQRHLLIMNKSHHFRHIKKMPSENHLIKLFPGWPNISLDFLGFSLKMDPLYRPTADELLKHNYFNHDKFAETFLPTIKEKARQELSDNALLRKYKAEILTQETREIRKPSYAESGKWKIHFVSDSVKRKLADFGTNEGSSDGGRSYINLSRVGSKLSSVQKIGYKNNQLQAIKRDDKNLTETNLNKMSSSTTKYSLMQKENPRLEKALDLLTKLNTKQHYRPKSTIKDIMSRHSGSNITPSPPPPGFKAFQSQSFRERSKSPSLPTTTILHPNITNICFSTKDSKKSPYLIQSVHNVSLKSVFNQVPITIAPKTTHLKRLDRTLFADSQFSKSSSMQSPVTLSFGTSSVKPETKSKSDEFTLPNVPGASGSTTSLKKKTPPDYHLRNLAHKPKRKDDCQDINKVIRYITLKPPPAFR